MPTPIATIVQSWANEYRDSALMSSLVIFAHLAGLVIGGGFALATDRATVRIARLPDHVDARRALLRDIGAVHRPIVYGVAVTFATGLLMLAADFDALVASRTFWIKMGLIAVLLANGWLMTRAERVLNRDPAPGNHAWRSMRYFALASFALWLAITFAGVWLTNG